MPHKKIELETHELNPAALWSNHLNAKIIPSFKEAIPDLKIKEDANKFSFIFIKEVRSIKFTWDENKFFKPSLFMGEKEIKIEHCINKDIRLDAILNGRDGQNFEQIVEFLNKGKIRLIDSLFFLL